MREIPNSVETVVIGAGVHGLSVAWHLAMEKERRGRGSGQDIVVLDKSGPGAGASGIACGCVRNFYMTEPIHALLRHSVDVWMHDPVAFGRRIVNDVGVVTLPEDRGKFAISVFTLADEGTAYDASERLIADLARTSYDFFLFHE